MRRWAATGALLGARRRSELDGTRASVVRALLLRLILTAARRPRPPGSCSQSSSGTERLIDMLEALGWLTEGNCATAKGAEMPRFLLALSVAVMLGTAATPAVADVHGVSNAECAAPGAPSGATTEASRSAPGRPAAPIPVTASDGRTQGRGDEADAEGTNC